MQTPLVFVSKSEREGEQVASTDTEWDFEVEVGEGKVSGRVQLLRGNFYSLIDNILSQQIITGDSRTLGMQMGRIKDALIWNGVPYDDMKGKNPQKYLVAEHPEVNGGTPKKFRLRSDEVLLNQPLVAEDGEWMARLGDKVAGAVVDRNPGLEAKYGKTVFGLFKNIEEDQEDEEEDDESGILVPDDEQEEDEDEMVAAGAENPTT